MQDFFALYDALLAGMGADADEITVKCTHSGRCWALCETAESTGIAMEGNMASAPRLIERDFAGLTLREAAKAVKSWNLVEAALGVAALNAYYNTTAHMNALGCYEPYENYCSRGLDFDGARIGVIGHMGLTPEIRGAAKEIFTLERMPKDGDYPDSACDFILPGCDYVFITGSTIMNKTLPHLLELCKNAVTILIGPSVPMCPALLDFGITRLSGMAVTDTAGMREHVVGGIGGNPYRFGTSFLLTK